MISDQDRSGWFGASDTHFIMGKWTSKTFTNWWLEKEGIRHNHFTNDSMIVGTNWEHKILESLQIEDMELDKQILIPELRLRVNLDGNDKTTDYECKTYRFEKGFKIPKSYIEQVNVQMYASGLKGKIISYGLVEEEYKNFMLNVDSSRVQEHEIAYDEKFIEQWLKRIKYFKECLDKSKFPSEEEFNVYSKESL